MLKNYLLRPLLGLFFSLCIVSVHGRTQEYKFTDASGNQWTYTVYRVAQHVINGDTLRNELMARIDWLAVKDSDVVVPDELPYEENMIPVYEICNVNGVSNRQKIRSLQYTNNLNKLPSSALNDCYNLCSVVLPKYIKEIPTFCFDHCYRLEHVEIPEGVELISNYAFRNCKSLRSFIIPDKVTSVGIYALQSCDSLHTIRVGASIQNWVFMNIPSLRHLIWNVKAYNTSMESFLNGYDVESIEFGDSVRVIRPFICSGLSSLKSLHLSANVDSIAPNALSGLTGLESITIDEDNSVYDCRENCQAIIHSIDNRLMYACNRSYIPNGIVSVDDQAFKGLTGIKKLYIPSSVESVGFQAFGSCVNLDSVIIADGLTYLPDYAFQACTALRYVSLAETIDSIGLRSFSHCTSLEKLTLPKSLRVLDECVFANCDNLTELNFDAIEPVRIRTRTFDSFVWDIHVPCEVVPDYRMAENWSDLGERVLGQSLYSLIVESADLTQGSASVIKRSNCEEPALVEAIPQSGYHLERWVNKTTGATVSTDAIYSFVQTEDLVLVAYFAKGEQESQGLTDTSVGLRWQTSGLNVKIESMGATTLRLFNIAGKLVDECQVANNQLGMLTAPAAGLYILQGANMTERIILQ